jgi:hypothetical protein
MISTVGNVVELTRSFFYPVCHSKYDAPSREKLLVETKIFENQFSSKLSAVRRKGRRKWQSNHKPHILYKIRMFKWCIQFVDYWVHAFGGATSA